MANIALNGNVTGDNTVAPFSASRAVDGIIEATHRWVGDVPCGLKLTLPATKMINRWVVSGMSKVTGWPAPGWTAPRYSISDYALQGCNDGISWVTLDTVSSNQVPTTDKTLATPANYQFYRVYVTKGLNCNNKVASIMDFQLYEAPPTSPYLSALTISSGTLTPVFNKNTYSYTASVGYDANSITVTPTAEVPTAYGLNASIKVNGVTVASGTGTPVVLNVGVNTIYIDVTSAVGNVTQRYTLTVTRASDPYLASVTGAGMPTFVKTTYQYTLSTTAGKLVVTATPEDTNAVITVVGNGTSIAYTQPFTFKLNSGSNTLIITATSSVGTDSRTYTYSISKS